MNASATTMNSMDDGLEVYLKGKHSGTFEGWDGFEISVQTRQRKGMEVSALVTLHNAGTGGFPTALHACFLITGDKQGNDVIRVGKHELAHEYNSAYAPVEITQ
jgi:hypothetical protein